MALEKEEELFRMRVSTLPGGWCFCNVTSRHTISLHVDSELQGDRAETWKQHYGSEQVEQVWSVQPGQSATFSVVTGNDFIPFQFPCEELVQIASSEEYDHVS